MDMHIKTYAITRRALEHLLMQFPGSPVEIPRHWFNWNIVNSSAGVGALTELTRFTVVEHGSYDEHRQRWVEACNQQGLLPVFIFSLEDGPDTAGWPESDPIDLMLPIRTGRPANSDLANLLELRPKGEAVVAVLPLPIDDPEICAALTAALSLPETAILSAWEEFCDTPAEELDDFCDIDVPVEVWLAIADGLEQWRNQVGVASHLADLGYPSLQDLKPAARLSWHEFAFEPSLEHIRQANDNSLYIPCRSAPFCGVGIRDGLPRPFGLLKTKLADESWYFGDSLRKTLIALQQQAQGAKAELTRLGTTTVAQSTLEQKLLETRPATPFHDVWSALLRAGQAIEVSLKQLVGGSDQIASGLAHSGPRHIIGQHDTFRFDEKLRRITSGRAPIELSIRQKIEVDMIPHDTQFDLISSFWLKADDKTKYSIGIILNGEEPRKWLPAPNDKPFENRTKVRATDKISYALRKDELL